MQKILANTVVLLGFVAIPLIPFIVMGDSTFFPFIVGKNFAFRIVVEVMFSAWIVLAVLDPLYRPKKSYLLGALVAFIGIITLAAIFGENPTKSFWSNFERMEGVVTYFHLLAYFIVASTVLFARNLWRPYLNFHLAMGVIMALYGVSQWAGVSVIVQDGMRVNGTLGNAAYLGTYTLFNAFLALFLMVHTGVTKAGAHTRHVVYGAIVALQVFVMYHTATRGAVLGLIAGLGLAMILVALFERERAWLRKGSIGVLVALTIFVGGFIAIRDTSFVRESPVLSRFASISFSEKTTKSRFMVWGMAYQGFKENPVLGWGMENFNYVFNTYYDPKMYDQEQWFDRAHNVFFDWLIAGGLPALLAYLSLFGCALYCIWKRAHSLSVVEKSVLTGLLGGYFFQNLFVFDNITSLIYFFTILAFVESLSREAYTPATKKNTKTPALGEGTSFALSVGAIALALVLVFGVNYKGYMQNRTLFRALSERSSTEGVAYNRALFEKAVSYGSFGTSEAREQLAQASLGSVEHGKALNGAQGDFLSIAADELVAQASELPRDARYQLFAGSFFSRVGRFDQAIAYLEKAHTLSPAKQAILFELGNVYYNKGDRAKAEEIFKKGYELAPEYEEAENLYLRILVENKNNEEVIRVLQVHSLREPKNAEMHIKLGAIYYEQGKRAEATAEVSRAVEIDPTLRARGEQYLKVIRQ